MLVRRTKDLAIARAKVAQAVLDADCFPAGMETFPASDDEQLTYIKKVIDQSDYYVLIIGARYGSVGRDGVSYTEREFEYALSIDLPLLVFAHEDPDGFPDDVKDGSDVLRSKLNDFRTKALHGRLVKFWKDADALANQVMRALLRSVKERPMTGWLRGASAEIEHRDSKIQELLTANAALLEQVRSLDKIVRLPSEDLSSGDDTVSLQYRYSYSRPSGRTGYSTSDAGATWNQILAHAGPDMLEWIAEATASKVIAELVGREKLGTPLYLLDDSLRTVRVQLLALELIERRQLSTTDGGAGIFWRLTDRGRNQLFRLRPIRRAVT